MSLLVERADLKRPTSNGCRELRQEEDPTEVHGAVGRQGQDRLASVGKSLDLLVEVREGLIGVAQVRDHAIAPVRLRRRQRLIDHRHDSPPLLTGRLSDQLLDPQPEALDRRRDHESQLVAPPEGELANDRAKPQPRVGLGGVEVGAVLLGHLAAVQQRLDVDAHQRRGHEPEVRQHRVAAADAGRVQERAPQPVIATEPLERAAGVGDDDELLRPGFVTEVPVVRQRLDRPAGLRGDDEQRLFEVQRLLDADNDIGMRGVEHLHAQSARNRAERPRDHLGAERRAPNAEHHSVGEPRRATLRRECLQLGRLLEHRFRDGQPAEPVPKLGRARLASPERWVLAPDALGDALGGGALDALCDWLRELGRQLRLDRRRLARDHGLAALLDSGQQAVHRVLELADAVDKQLVGVSSRSIPAFSSALRSGVGSCSTVGP